VQLAKQVMGSLTSMHVTAHTIRRPGTPASRCRPHCRRAAPGCFVHLLYQPNLSVIPNKQGGPHQRTGSAPLVLVRPGDDDDAMAARVRSDATHKSSMQAAASFRAEDEEVNATNKTVEIKWMMHELM